MKSFQHILAEIIVFFTLFSVPVWAGETVFFQETSIPRDTMEGIVLAVFDGDTIYVEFPDAHREKVRLIGIDCFEMDDPDPVSALMALAAKRSAFLDLYGKKIKLTFDREERDKYGRLLAYVWTDEGELINKVILEKGLAAVMERFSFMYKPLFLKVEQEAVKKKIGIWSEGDFQEIPLSKAGQYLGQLVTVRIRCDRIMEKSRFLYLRPEADGFAAVIPQGKRGIFPDLVSYKNKEIQITGLLEEYRGEAQIMIELFSQIKILKSDESIRLISLLYDSCLGIIPP